MSQDAVAVSAVATPAETFHFTVPEVVAGAVAGFCEHFVMFPFDTIKTRIQDDAAQNLRSVFRQIFRDERLTHLYRGCMPVLISAIPAHAAYFSVYEASKRPLHHYGNIGIAVCACLATIAHDIVSTPFDVVKQRMQMDGARQYGNSLHCARSLLKHEGLSAFYVSLPTTIAMNAPHYATYWLVYEWFMRARSQGKVRHTEDELTTDHLVGGFLAGAAASLVSYPFDTVKTYLQLGHGTGFFSSLTYLLQTRGKVGIFNGVLARALYTAPSGAIMMATYEAVKNSLIRHNF